MENVPNNSVICSTHIHKKETQKKFPLKFHVCVIKIAERVYIYIYVNININSMYNVNYMYSLHYTFIFSQYYYFLYHLSLSIKSLPYAIFYKISFKVFNLSSMTNQFIIFGRSVMTINHFPQKNFITFLTLFQGYKISGGKIIRSGLSEGHHISSAIPAFT